MKFLRVNMSDKTVRTEDVPKPFVGLGGRCLTSCLVNAEVPAKCNAVGPENKLVFAPGLLSGTPMVNTGRLSIGAKSPLTGGIKESNVGGTAAAALARLGITAVIVEGQAQEGDLSILRIDSQGRGMLIDARAFRMARTYELVEKLLGEYGEKNNVLCIGPAGEQRMLSASIQSSDTDNRPCRAAGRGGLGAVMGAKGLKALVVDRSGKNLDPLADEEAFKGASKVFAKAVQEDVFSGQIMPALGTAALVGVINSVGAFPTNNARKGVFEGWEKISGEKMAETIIQRGGKTTHTGCSQCIVNCSNVYVDQGGQYVTSSLEYETIWATGGMCGIDDLDTIARLDFLCDDIGLDTMNTGVAVAVAMDAGYKNFGDSQAAIEMIEETARGTEMGLLIGNGPAAVGKHFNHPRVPVVKNQSIAAYDPRAIQGYGVTYAISPMGADHTSGPVLAENLAAFGGKLDPLKPQGQMANSRNNHIAAAIVDSLGLCLLASPCLSKPEAMGAVLTMVNAKLGTRFGPNELAGLGIKTIHVEREFNRKAGLTMKDDRLPKFFKEEPLPPNNTVFQVQDYELDGAFVILGGAVYNAAL
jgi:aldehyde:ferredoxin oxidoreductase